MARVFVEPCRRLLSTTPALWVLGTCLLVTMWGWGARVTGPTGQRSLRGQAGHFKSGRMPHTVETSSV